MKPPNEMINWREVITKWLAADPIPGYALHPARSAIGDYSEGAECWDTMEIKTYKRRITLVGKRVWALPPETMKRFPALYRTKHGPSCWIKASIQYDDPDAQERFTSALRQDAVISDYVSLLRSEGADRMKAVAASAGETAPYIHVNTFAATMNLGNVNVRLDFLKGWTLVASNLTDAMVCSATAVMCRCGALFRAGLETTPEGEGRTSNQNAQGGATMKERYLKEALADHALWMLDYNKGQHADFRAADLRDAKLDGAYLALANLEGSCLAGANLEKADLRRALFTKADLTRANLTGANAQGAWFAHANLAEANLTGANLTGADLFHAQLNDADLAWANLMEADLTGADLTGANLTGANLTGANLTGANLTGANMTDADLTRVDPAGG